MASKWPRRRQGCHALPAGEGVWIAAKAELQELREFAARLPWWQQLLGDLLSATDTGFRDFFTERTQ